MHSNHHCFPAYLVKIFPRRDYVRLRFVGNDSRDRLNCVDRPRSVNPSGRASARPDSLTVDAISSRDMIGNDA
jgi:hypothetical protein